MKIGKTIYLDHQATTPVDPRVLSEMMPFFCDGFGNPHSLDHSIGWEAAKAVEKAATNVAQLVGADADEVIFTSGATESNNHALLGLGRGGNWKKRKRILISSVEHKSVIAIGRVLQNQLGFSVESIPTDAEGFVNQGILKKLLDEDVLAVSIMAVNNEIGTIQDIKSISELVRRYGAILHCDAAQAPVTMRMEKIALHADILSLSSHKMYGPKGIGAIVISRELQGKIEPIIHGGEQQNASRAGTVPTPLCVGMGAAATILMGKDADKTRHDLRRRRDFFVDRLIKSRWPIALNGPKAKLRHFGNANLRFSGFSASEILGVVQPFLAASTGSACTSGIQEASYVLEAIGLDSDESRSSIRFSLGFGTTDNDIEQAVTLIEEALERLSTLELS